MSWNWSKKWETFFLCKMREMIFTNVGKLAITCFEPHTLFSMSPNCRRSRTNHALSDMFAIKPIRTKIILIFWTILERNVHLFGREHIPIILAIRWFTCKVFILTTKQNPHFQIKSRQWTNVFCVLLKVLNSKINQRSATSCIFIIHIVRVKSPHCTPWSITRSNSGFQVDLWSRFLWK